MFFQPEGEGLLAAGGRLLLLPGVFGLGRNARLRLGVELPADPRAYAAALYGALHRLDGQGLQWIAVGLPPDTPDWAGVLDRLRRAAER